LNGAREVTFSVEVSFEEWVLVRSIMEVGVQPSMVEVSDYLAGLTVAMLDHLVAKAKGRADTEAAVERGDIEVGRAEGHRGSHR
jgi:hypothetical protein